MAAHYHIWLILISIIATSGAIFIAFGFVDKMTQSPNRLTHALGFQMTAEGIEDKAQQDTII
ncbi:MAG: hypothetical protein K0U17_06815, partial [Betaproteobacteria bacterium]|nr:hypothetical protein [Betaproteobacteria bacterium]